MGFIIGPKGRIVPEDISASEIECCLSCMLYAASGRPMGDDLLFMQWRHADHTVNPGAYQGELDGIEPRIR